MTFLLETDNGVSPDLHAHNNGSDGNRAFFQALLDEAKAYGIRYRLWTRSKYFLWRLCYYLAYYSAYYPILGGDIGEPHGALCWYLRCAEEQEPQSVLFSMIRQGIGTHAWAALSKEDIAVNDSDKALCSQNLYAAEREGQRRSRWAHPRKRQRHG